MSEQREKLENQSEKSASDNESAPDSTSSLEEEDKLAVLSMTKATFRGPLPPPEVLRMYDEAVPGSAERITKMAEKRTASLHEERKIGQYGGIVIACLSILGGCSIAFFSDSWYTSLAAVLIVAIGVGGPIAALAFVKRFSKGKGRSRDGMN